MLIGSVTEEEASATFDGVQEGYQLVYSVSVERTYGSSGLKRKLAGRKQVKILNINQFFLTDGRERCLIDVGSQYAFFVQPMSRLDVRMDGVDYFITRCPSAISEVPVGPAASPGSPR
ncbi:hypothetical protein [Erythrobacter oryzae]|uniref:hypothetical protein n=1 Tax=Erythrobacter oryzae TaxID=3019556 RepID=UPI002555DBAD|nr:hypothetical protein [Erythrobacter sp. COR-2]